MNCPLCDTEVKPDHDSRPIVPVTGGTAQAHRECLLREVMGGIGHLTDHEFWCGHIHDPDAGHTYRKSALLVDQWVESRRKTL